MRLITLVKILNHIRLMTIWIFVFVMFNAFESFSLTIKGKLVSLNDSTVINLSLVEEIDAHDKVINIFSSDYRGFISKEITKNTCSLRLSHITFCDIVIININGNENGVLNLGTIYMKEQLPWLDVDCPGYSIKKQVRMLRQNTRDYNKSVRRARNVKIKNSACEYTMIAKHRKDKSTGRLKLYFEVNYNKIARYEDKTIGAFI